MRGFTERGDTEKNLRENLCVVAHITGDSASKKKNIDTDIKIRAQINTHSHTCAHTQVYLESTVAEHSYDTEKYHGGQYSSGYDNSSSCHPTSSPSNSATAQPV